MTEGAATVFTVGHSNHGIDEFLALLRDAGVTAIADVRSTPYSRYLDHFDRENLAQALRKAGIAYVYLGDRLGGRPSDPSLYSGGVADYEKVARSQDFKGGLARVLRGARRYRLALMCSEKDPLDCHRFLLVSRGLKAAGAKVEHLHADGRIESMAEAERRLVEATGQQQTRLFGGGDSDPLAEAYRIRARTIGFNPDEAERQAPSKSSSSGQEPAP